MSISQRAIAMKEIPEHERPISEEFRIAAKEWVAAKKAFRMLDETKTAKLARMKQTIIMDRAPDKVSDAEADRLARSTDEWMAWLENMVEMEAGADLARVKMKWIELRYGEWQSDDANSRRERQMGRQAP